MIKLKKSVKAIIISICLVVVLAGSVLGVVLSRKDKEGDNNPSNSPASTSPVTPASPLPPEVTFTSSQQELMNSINSTHAKIEIVEKFDSEIVSQGSFEVANVNEITNKYLVLDNNGEMSLYFYTEQNKVYSFYSLEDLVDENSEYENFVVISSKNGYVLYSYCYSVDYVTYEVFEVAKINDVNDITVLNSFVMKQLDSVRYEYNGVEYSRINISLKNSYYYTFFTKVSGTDTTYDLCVYDYSDTMPTDDKIRKYKNLTGEYDFYDNYLFVQLENIVNVCALNQLINKLVDFQFETNDDHSYRFNYLKSGIFVTDTIRIENATDLKETTVSENGSHYNYSYRYFDFKTETINNVYLESGVAKAEFVDVLDGKYLALFEQKVKDHILEKEGIFVYYELDTFNKLISYSATSKDERILYASSNSILTNSGIYKISEGLVSNKLFDFNKKEATTYSVETINFVSDNFIVKNSSRKFQILNMDGKFLNDYEFDLIKEYDSGNYIAKYSNEMYLLNINTLVITKIENYDFTDTNNSLSMVGFGVFIETANDGYVIKNYLGNILENNIKSYEILNQVVGTSLRLTKNDNSIVYYLKKGIYISGNSNVGSAPTSGINLVANEISPFADTDGGNSKDYYYDGVKSGTCSLSHTSGKGGYTWATTVVSDGFYAWGGRIVCVGGGHEDAGITTSIWITDEGKWAISSSVYTGDVNVMEHTQTSWNNDGGAEYAVKFQFKDFTNYYSCGGFDNDDSANNYLSVEPIEYTLTFNKQGGSGGSDSATQKYTESITSLIVEPSRTGYKFGGYYTSTGGNGTKVYTGLGAVNVGDTQFTTSTTLYAQWKAITYSLLYNYNGGSCSTTNPSSATYDVSFSVTKPTKLGYTFSSWTITGVDTNITGQTATSYKNLTSVDNGILTFNANWSENWYYINYALNDGTHGSNHPDDAYYTTVVTINNPTKKGYTFDGWDITDLTADNHSYGSYTTSNTYIYGTKVTTFQYLRSDNGYTATFTANWSPIEYGITYNYNGGTANGGAAPTSGTYDEWVVVANPVRHGYSFTSWTISNMDNDTHYRKTWSTSSASSFTDTSKNVGTDTYFKNLRCTAENVTFTAAWQVNSYSIEYNYDGGSCSVTNPSSANFGSAFNVTRPTKTGYLFTHWSLSDLEDKGVTNADVVHYHGTTEANVTSTNFKGTTCSSTTKSWFRDLRSRGGTSAKFKANWEPITYNLAYNANGGAFEVTNPDEATYDQSFSVTSPKRVGYNFIGWEITDSANTVTKATSSKKSNYPNTRTDSYSNRTTSDGATVTFKALWERVTYKIKFVYNSSYHTDTTGSYDFSDSTGTEGYYKIDNPKKMGYLFNYWEVKGMCDNCTHYRNTSNSTSGQKTFTGTSISEIKDTYFKNLHCTEGSTVTFTAHWTAKTYTVINGASSYGSTPASTTVRYDNAFSLTKPTSSPFGYHFYGWKITQMNTNDENTNQEVTHYAGSTSSTTTSFKGASKELNNIASHSKYYFKNLSSNNNATVKIDPIWEENFYKVTFDLNNPNRATNDISPLDDIQAQYNIVFSVTYPTKSGYTFQGWSIANMTDNCTHYYGSNNSTSNSFESNNGKFLNPANPNLSMIVKVQYFKNLRSDNNSSTKAKLIANWKANTYTITYHYLPANFDVTAYSTSQLNTHVNVANQMTQSQTRTVTYDKKYVAINAKEEDGSVNFGIPVGMRLILWSISSTNITSTATVLGKYNSSSVIISALSDSIYPMEERIYGPGRSVDPTCTWSYYSAHIHLYATYDLAGINLRYFAPNNASNSNYLNYYSNVSSLNTSVKYTESMTFANPTSISNHANLVGWMVSADYFSTGQITERSVTIYDYFDTTFVAYRGTPANWGFKNTEAYSDEEPTFFLYAVYSDTYSGSYEALSFTYLSGTNSYSAKGRKSTHSGNLKVPTYYNDGVHGYLPVTEIAASAFESYSSVTSFTLPYTITTFNNRVFYNCDYFTSITLPSNLATIGNYAFYDCDGLTSITMPSKVKSIGTYAFYDCGAMTSVSFNRGLETIGSRAFGYTALSGGVTLSATVKSVGTYAFRNCTSMTGIRIPASLEVISDYMFYYCTALTTVGTNTAIALSKIGACAFYNCTALSSISLPNSVKTIGNSAFRYCSNLSSISMPFELTTLGTYAFANCTNLVQIDIPQKLSTIGNYAFYNCSDLVRVNIYSKNLSSIGTSAFSGTGLLYAYLYMTSAQYNAISISSGNTKFTDATRYWR